MCNKISRHLYFLNRSYKSQSHSKRVICIARKMIAKWTQFSFVLVPAILDWRLWSIKGTKEMVFATLFTEKLEARESKALKGEGV